jgi:hypothetical protein
MVEFVSCPLNSHWMECSTAQCTCLSKNGPQLINVDLRSDFTACLYNGEESRGKVWSISALCKVNCREFEDHGNV